jgi:DNA-binding helix-hairpin-helix protein with protein kinase domain
MILKPLTYNAIYPDGSFEKVTLGEVINKGGAAGRILSVEDHSDLVAKIFHSLNKSSTNREKLQAMLLNRPNFSPARKNGKEYTDHNRSYVQIAWPEAILEDENGFCVGYLMPLIDLSHAASLDHFMQRAIRQKLKLSEKYEHRIQVAYNLSTMVAALHQKQHYIVDLKPSNVYIYKENMLVAMLDSDGFSIHGENTRYPAEFVSEEYIYPEGMEQNCEDMGQEQDQFALAVIIFKLLNNGIHPYSGTPRKAASPAYTIQERIAKNHYAYGSWADLYQAPHPYSIHDYFDKKTLELFDRAFVKGMKRPAAVEWELHLRNLLQNMRQCKKNPNHGYFTAKGCGLCIAEEKFKSNLADIRKQLTNPKTIRGLKIENMSPEKIEHDKEKQRKRNIKLNYLTVGGLLLVLTLGGFLYRIISPFKKDIQNIGIGIQTIIVIWLMLGLNKIIKKITPKLPFFSHEFFPIIIQAYALICMAISLIIINDIPLEILLLSK